MIKILKSLMIMQTKILPNCVFLIEFSKIMAKLLWASADSSRNGALPSH